MIIFLLIDYLIGYTSILSTAVLTRKFKNGALQYYVII